MKLAFALLSAAFGAVSATGPSIEITSVKADSKFGMDLLSKARKLEQNGADEADQTWITNYSLKFIGCHHISQWNGEVEDADEVRIETVRLARFRLCPTSSCAAKHSQGCSSAYGDYVVDMDQFLATYLENKQEVIQETCENYSASYCNCENYYGDADQCEYNCFMKAGMTDCVDQNANNGYGYNNLEFELNNYLECAQYQPQNQNNNGRRLDGAEDGGDVEYYIGTYCASQGGSVVLGMFTDDACTNFADYNGGRTTFYNLEGRSLPYSDESIIDDECYTCQDQGENNGYGYEVNVKEACTNVYQVAGKCESSLSGVSSYPNENACQYISGIEITSANGIINSGAGRSNKVADAFIGIFACSFVLLGSYVYYLKTKLDRGKINLSD